MRGIRVGIVGLGTNTRLRHVPGLRACSNVDIVAVCNRRPESTRAAADEFGIPATYADWRELVQAPNVDAVVIGTWPYLHEPITVAALAAGKHVLCEARMACDLAEARRMLDASRQNPNQVAQVVPSPFGLRGHRVVGEMLQDGFIGDLREVVVQGTNAALSDPSTALHWRQDGALSGINMLSLGILHETLVRWVPRPVRVMAQTHCFTSQRPDPDSGELRPVGTPDSVHVLSELATGARCTYHLSGVVHFGPQSQIQLYGSRGTIVYQFAPEDRLFAGSTDQQSLREVRIPVEKEGCWRVEEEFIESIRGNEAVRLTDFETGVHYMQFTAAVAASARSGMAVMLDEM